MRTDEPTIVTWIVGAVFGAILLFIFVIPIVEKLWERAG